jgi:1-acyl-sn-glycerol-3-phosphate acyltransferase
MAEKRSRLMVYRVFASTLGYSARVLLDATTGRMSIQSVDRILEKWSREMYDTGRTSLDIRGLEHVVRGQSYVVMSNHQSLLDVPTVLRAFPGSVRMVSKSELAKIPLFGPAMRAAGTIIVDRSNREAAIASLKHADELIEHGVSMWIAPEGTRSKDGMLLPFKKGGFHVALDLGVPILPVFIDGTRQILETKTLSALPGQHVEIRFAEPVPTEGLTTDDLPALMGTVRRRMLELARDMGAAAGAELHAS